MQSSARSSPAGGDGQIEREAARLAYALDPAAVAARHRLALRDRRVSVRPAPDGMCRLSALLPLVQGIAGYAALRAEADRRVGLGENRDPHDPNGKPLTREHLMADIAVERLTGQSCAEDVAVEVNVVMTDATLLGDSREPATIPGLGPLAAPLARDLAYRNRTRAPRWIRRLYTDPGSGHLVGMDSRRRLFSDNQQRFLLLRDHTCRTPYCDAPIRQADHTERFADGGSTSTDNGTGRCVACNLAKEAIGWSTISRSNGAIEITTPTGHRYESRPPDPPGARRSRPAREPCAA